MPQLCHSCRALASTAMPKRAQPPADDAADDDAAEAGEAGEAGERQPKRVAGRTYEQYLAELKRVHNEMLQLQLASEYVLGMRNGIQGDRDLAGMSKVRAYLLSGIHMPQKYVDKKLDKMHSDSDTLLQRVELKFGASRALEMKDTLHEFQDDIRKSPQKYDDGSQIPPDHDPHAEYDRDDEPQPPLETNTTYEQCLEKLKPVYKKILHFKQAAKYVDQLCINMNEDESLKHRPKVRAYLDHALTSLANSFLNRETRVETIRDKVLEQVGEVLGEDDENELEMELDRFIDNASEHDDDSDISDDSDSASESDSD